MGYHRAGFDVIGVDINPQPNYPFSFCQVDVLAIAYSLSGFAAIHASPPCQANLRGLRGVNRARGRTDEHVDLIPQTRELLRASGLPYVIENVMGAALINPVRMCGSSFGLPIRRHRQFESNVPLSVPPCDHSWQTERKYWTSLRPNGEHKRSFVVQVYGAGGETHEWGPALGIDWMTPRELTQAIPPVYTEHIGKQLIAHLQTERAA